MRVEDFLTRLESVRHVGNGYLARCPAHHDRTPSLSVREGERGILIRCWAGCAPREITSALGLSLMDLFFDAPIAGGQSPTPKSPKLDLVAIAFYFELAALDRRLQAERIVSAGKALDVSSLNDAELDRALSAVATAYADVERAELFETVADDLRLKSFTERDHDRQDRVA